MPTSMAEGLCAIFCTKYIIYIILPSGTIIVLGCIVVLAQFCRQGKQLSFIWVHTVCEWLLVQTRMFAGSELSSSINQEKSKHMARAEVESLGLLLTSGFPNFNYFPWLKLKSKKLFCTQEHHLIAWKRRQATLSPMITYRTLNREGLQTWSEMLLSIYPWKVSSVTGFLFCWKGE